jgi:23S rRNA (pseudouridine1915-N3)-methyltransferase
MRVRLIAVGTRQSGWVDQAFDDYARRLRPTMPLELVEVPAVKRSASTDAATIRMTEGKRIRALLGAREHAVALDERGAQFSTAELAVWLEERRRSGRDLALVVGGADGLAPELLSACAQSWSLSRLTLPHGLVRVLLAEQLYRAASILAGHPYHRA